MYRPNRATPLQAKPATAAPVLRRATLPQPSRATAAAPVVQRATPAPSIRPNLPNLRTPVVQRLIRVSPTDVDPVAGVRHSTFNQHRFTQAWNALNGTNFRNTLNQHPAVRQNFTFAFLDNALVAAERDIPHLAAAMINAVTAAPAIRLALTAHIGDLERALGAHAHTDAGAGDAANFRALAGAGGIVPSRRKGVPNQMTLGALDGVSHATHTALTHLITAVTNRNDALNTVTDYVTGWTPRGRASLNFAAIRSAHQNGAGWLHPFTAGAAVGLEAGLLAAALAHGQNLVASGKPSKIAMGTVLVNAAQAAGAQASDVEQAVDNSGNVALKNYFYRTVFWTAVGTKVNRVLLAWARYASDAGAIQNCPYIEFAGGGVANRFIWDYVHDTFFLSVHYNWVDGYNPFFEITGTQRTFN